MFHRVLALTAGVTAGVMAAFALAGCAAPTAAVSVAQPPWRDSAFGYDANLVTVKHEDLFRLDPELTQRLAGPSAELGSRQKLNHLLTLVFGPDLKGFAYRAGHSTVASETWQRKAGDCLSLTVLTYAVARTLGVEAQMQEVQTPQLYDRRGSMDFVNQHVNVLFRRAYHSVTEFSQPTDIVVDFEPDFASGRAGKPLTERAVLARYYNNVATEHMAAGRQALAYAHFKAAILADPGYSSSFGNLAVLYLQNSLPTEAEALLRHAILLGDSGDVAIHALRDLMAAQGNTAEVKRLEAILKAREAGDPYFWIAKGVELMKEGDWRRAIRALEEARDITANFSEVHRLLAVAYARAGEPARADQELALLASVGDESVSKLRKKFRPLLQ